MQQLHHYTWLLSRWFLLILLVAIICSGLTFGICKYLIAPVYQASALIRVNGPVITNTGSSGTDVFSQEALAVGDAILVTSTDILKAVADEIPGQSVSQLQNEVNAAPQQGTQIIEVRAQAHTPQLAATIANTVVNVFIQTEVTQATASLKTLDSQLSQDLTTTQDDITQAQAQLDKLKHSGASADQIAQQNNLIATYQANYNTYLASYHQLLAQKNQAQRALSVSQVAIPPNKPVSPTTTLDTIVAGGLTMVLMIALALLIDWLDTSIKTPEDVANLALLEPLGSVPVSKKPLLLVHQEKSSVTSDVAIEQAFLILANGSRVLSDGRCAILVTSLRSGAGVTTIATNLAILLAQSGKRVMLVDAHLRQPALHKVFNRPDTRGLVDVLATDVHKFQERGIRSWLNLWDTPIPNLWLLPADATPSQIRLLKRLRELRMLKDWLLNSSENPADRAFPGVVDVVIFDAPALRNESDAMALASIADSSILVVTAGKERSETVKKAGMTLQRLGAPVLGVVVNRQTTKHRPY
ncbi:MAG TPA: Wzz/FepE/Etk N-terminal domain-containing protein, partial [Ktedonobacteraceae bacterium]